MSSVKVAVRVRPFNTREKDRHAALIIEMQGAATRITNPTTGRSNTFTFDHSFWTHDPASPHYANQEHVYEALGREMMTHAFEGYNVCIFAYGQTGTVPASPSGFFSVFFTLLPVQARASRTR
jgi:kinesin family protein 1